ncbi:MAG: hypothetical protein ACK53Y_12365, partial [bacterium]
MTNIALVERKSPRLYIHTFRQCVCKFVKCNELQLGRPLPQQRPENSPHSQRPEAGNCEAIFKTILGKHIQYLGMVIIGFC